MLLASCSLLLGGCAAREGALGKATTLLERLQRHNVKTWEFLVEGGHVQAIKSLPVWKKVEEMAYEAELEEGVQDLLGPLGGRLLGVLRGFVYETDLGTTSLKKVLLGADGSYRPKS